MTYRDSEKLWPSRDLGASELGGGVGRQNSDLRSAGNILGALRGICGGDLWGGRGSGGTGKTSARKGLIPSRDPVKRDGTN